MHIQTLNKSQKVEFYMTPRQKHLKSIFNGLYSHSYSFTTFEERLTWCDVTNIRAV